MPTGVACALDLHSMTGAVDADVPRGSDCRIAAHTVSGSITVR
jgi:hypothetical protein